MSSGWFSSVNCTMGRANSKGLKKKETLAEEDVNHRMEKRKRGKEEKRQRNLCLATPTNLGLR
jgi:hypothetical protein